MYYEFTDMLYPGGNISYNMQVGYFYLLNKMNIIGYNWFRTDGRKAEELARDYDNRKDPGLPQKVLPD